MAELAKTAQGGAVASAKTHQMVVVDLQNPQELPDLNESVESPVSLSAVYWTPENPGEEKRLFFVGFQPHQAFDPNTAETKVMEAVAFIEQTKDSKGNKVFSKIVNASKKLVSVMQLSLESNVIQPGSAVIIRYLGKKKNKTNGNFSDNWEVKNLMQQIAAANA